MERFKGGSVGCCCIRALKPTDRMLEAFIAHGISNLLSLIAAALAKISLASWVYFDLATSFLKVNASRFRIAPLVCVHASESETVPSATLLFRLRLALRTSFPTSRPVVSIMRLHSALNASLGSYQALRQVV